MPPTRPTPDLPATARVVILSVGAMASATSAMPAFRPAPAFVGRQWGYVFKSGEQGLGYYRDPHACPQHPYGVEPSRYNSRVGHTSSATWLLRSLDDTLRLTVLGFLDAQSLCTVAAASRDDYCYAHATVLWRDLALRMHGGGFHFRNTWRETCTGHPHSPQPTCGQGVVFSDVLYDPWYQAAALTVEPRWLERSNVDRRSVNELSKTEFVERYEKPGKPVIITDCVPGWPAATEWTEKRLLERFPDREFRVSATTHMTLARYLHYCQACRGDERPLYLFEKDFCTKCPEMANEFHIPPYFTEDLMGVLGEDRRPDYKWLIIGPALSGSSFHVDPNANFAWNATIQGRKKWIFYPPGHPPPLSFEGDRQISLLQWFHEHYDNDPNEGIRLECVTEGGECMYVPRGWWHCVLNLDMCIAITHNVVTSQNLLPAIEFLEGGETCPPGFGCRGAEHFNLSGDVPTSVIFPYKARVEHHGDDEAGARLVTVTTGDAGGETLTTCACHAKQRQLLLDFRAALAQHRPGLLERLQHEQAQFKVVNVPWTQLVPRTLDGEDDGGTAKQVDGEGTDAPAHVPAPAAAAGAGFSFNFF